MVTWSTKSPRSARSSSTSRYDSEKRKYQPTANRIISGSNWRHLNRPATEGARTISAQLIRPLLQTCNTSLFSRRLKRLRAETRLIRKGEPGMSVMKTITHDQIVGLIGSVGVGKGSGKDRNH